MSIFYHQSTQTYCIGSRLGNATAMFQICACECPPLIFRDPNDTKARNLRNSIVAARRSAPRIPRARITSRRIQIAPLARSNC